MSRNHIKIYNKDGKLIHKIEEDIVTKLVNAHLGPQIPKNRRNDLVIQVGNGEKVLMDHVKSKNKEVSEYVKGKLYNGRGSFATQREKEASSDEDVKVKKGPVKFDTEPAKKKLVYLMNAVPTGYGVPKKKKVVQNSYTCS
jgi:hypothetical protein